VHLSVILGGLAAVLGLVIGSYLNVVIYRLPRGLSTVKPRSRCPGCGKPIGARDNVPVLSFLWLRGRCRHCGVRISWQYPLTELATGLLFLASFLRFGVSFQTIAAWIFCALMVVLASIDVELLILPDAVTWPGIALGLLVQPFAGWAGSLGAPGLAGRLLAGAWGAALGAAIILALWGAWLLLMHAEGMGLGDSKMLALIGAFLGWKGVLVTVFFSSLLGALVGLALLPWSRKGLKTALPFGFFLALGGLIALFNGADIAAFYGGLLVPRP
jgi:leader peptidase (prepilin peptidase)/N-methyltransferase